MLFGYVMEACILDECSCRETIESSENSIKSRVLPNAKFVLYKMGIIKLKWELNLRRKSCGIQNRKIKKYLY